MTLKEHRETDVYAIVVGRVIASLREREGMTQAALAEQADLSQSMVSRLERGQTQPDAFTLKKIAEAFDMTPGELTEQIDRAYARTEETTRGLVSTNREGPWWKTALAVAGVVGLAGLVAFAVVAILEESDKKR